MVLWGLRVNIPTPLKQRILGEKHEAHLEMFKMKALARGYHWWPASTKDIETTVKSHARIAPD